ncbi:small subunit processome component 20-like protein [Chlorella sorokiniana]|uniref:Small subunit processome component 20-like protein n=1 Tax=Chlorella sorokiniana TaxID=3076 RepID=A0A2P6TXU2_CHLSO|nr:small subunit processome component 20-like protein [Chlorella sorokiniana]|eukprot:PRW58885.1 small subunit processome component 20-like protein [Chlorella sorokiniana]
MSSDEELDLQPKPKRQKRFKFKTFEERVADVEVDVYRSLGAKRAEPLPGCSSFFQEGLAKWRELNSAEHWLAAAAALNPLTQSLPQLVHHRDEIAGILLGCLRMEALLSLEPALELTGTLARDLQGDYLPLLPVVLTALVDLVDEGLDREPEQLQHLFACLSLICKHLCKLLAGEAQLLSLLKASQRLRHHRAEHVRALAAESLGFLFRQASGPAIRVGVKAALAEAVTRPTDERVHAAGALLAEAVTGVSHGLHSRAAAVLGPVLREGVLRPDDFKSAKSQAGGKLGQEAIQARVAAALSVCIEHLAQHMRRGKCGELWQLLLAEVDSRLEALVVAQQRQQQAGSGAASDQAGEAAAPATGGKKGKKGSKGASKAAAASAAAGAEGGQVAEAAAEEVAAAAASAARGIALLAQLVEHGRGCRVEAYEPLFRLAARLVKPEFLGSSSGGSSAISGQPAAAADSEEPLGTAPLPHGASAVPADFLRPSLSAQILRLLLALALSHTKVAGASEGPAALVKAAPAWAPAFVRAPPAELMPFTRSLISYPGGADVARPFSQQMLGALGRCLLAGELSEVCWPLLMDVCATLRPGATAGAAGVPIILTASGVGSQLAALVRSKLQSFDREAADDASAAAEAWAALACLPHAAESAAQAAACCAALAAATEPAEEEEQAGGQGSNSDSSSSALLMLHCGALGAQAALLAAAESAQQVQAQLLPKALALLVRHPGNYHAVAAAAAVLQAASAVGADLSLQQLQELLPLLAPNLSAASQPLRRETLRVLCCFTQPAMQTPAGAEEPPKDAPPQPCDALQQLLVLESRQQGVDGGRPSVVALGRMRNYLEYRRLPDWLVPAVIHELLGVLHIRFAALWNPAHDALGMALDQYPAVAWPLMHRQLAAAQEAFLAGDCFARPAEASAAAAAAAVGYQAAPPPLLQPRFLAAAASGEEAAAGGSTDAAVRLNHILKAMAAANTNVVESKARDWVPLFLAFTAANPTAAATEDGGSAGAAAASDQPAAEDSEEEEEEPTAGGSGQRQQQRYGSGPLTGRAWRSGLREWLALLGGLKGARGMFQWEAVQRAVAVQLMDVDPAIQTGALKCLKVFKLKFLLPYLDRLLRLADNNTLREELTAFPLAVSATSLREDEGGSALLAEHRAGLVPLLIRLLFPKMRKRSGRLGGKGAPGSARAAILNFLAAAEPHELRPLLELFLAPLSAAFVRPADEAGQRELEALVGQDDPDAYRLIEGPWWGRCLGRQPGAWWLEHIDAAALNAEPLRKRIGYLNTLEDLLKHLGHRMQIFLPELLALAVCLLEGGVQPLLADGAAAEGAAGAEVAAAAAGDLAEGAKEVRSRSLRLAAAVLDRFPTSCDYCFLWPRLLAATQPLLPRLAAESAADKAPPLIELAAALAASQHLVPVLADGTSAAIPAAVARQLAAQPPPPPAEVQPCSEAWAAGGAQLGSALLAHCIGALSAPRCSEPSRIAMLGALESIFDLPDPLPQQVLGPHMPALLQGLQSIVVAVWQQGPGGGRTATGRKAGRGRGGAGGGQPAGPRTGTASRALAILELVGSRVASWEAAQQLTGALLPLLQPREGAGGRRKQRRGDEVLVARTLAVLAALWSRLPAAELEQRPQAGEQLLTVAAVLAPLAGSLEGRDSRQALCAAYTSVASLLAELAEPAALLTELNALSTTEIDELDYERRMAAYSRLLPAAWQPLSVRQAAPLLHTCLHDLRNAEDLALRHAASQALSRFIEGAAAATEAAGAAALAAAAAQEAGSLLPAAQRVLFPQLKRGLPAPNLAVRQEHLVLLRQLVLAFPAHYAELLVLTDTDAEVDFLLNVAHIQLHRRARALVRLTKLLKRVGEDTSAPSPLGVGTLVGVVQPLLLQMVVEGKGGEDGSGGHELKQADKDRGANVTDAAVVALGAVAGALPWVQYQQLLGQHLRLMKRHADDSASKAVIRAVCSILDAFHFPLPDELDEAQLAAEAAEAAALAAREAAAEQLAAAEAADAAEKAAKKKEAGAAGAEGEEAEEAAEDEEMPDATVVGCEATVLDADEAAAPAQQAVPAGEVYRMLAKRVVPELQRIMVDKETVRAPVALAVVKVLQLLPAAAMRFQLPRTLQKVANLLRVRLQSTRDAARAVLVSMVKQLGPDYLPFVCEVLQSACPPKGFTAHVLGYTVNAVIEAVAQVGQPGCLDDSLLMILPLMEADLFGEVAEAKEAVEFAGAYKEAKKCRAYETYQLLAGLITFGERAAELLTTVQSRLGEASQPKTRTKLAQLLQHAARGVLGNPTATAEDICMFFFATADSGLAAEEAARDKAKAAAGAAVPTGKGGDDGGERAAALHQHLLVEFALSLLQGALRKGIINPRGPGADELLDPLLPLLVRALRSRHAPSVTTALQALTLLMQSQLPGLQKTAADAGKAVTELLKRCPKTSHPIAQDCLKLLGGMLRQCERWAPSQGQLRFLVTWAFADLEATAGRQNAFHLLKAILARKLVLPEVYDLMNRVQELMVQSQAAPVRSACSSALLQFLLDYPLGEKRLQEHLQFLLTNLSYEHESGREAALDMLGVVLQKFPEQLVGQWAEMVFLPLVARLVNDPSSKCRQMVGACLSTLLRRAPPARRDRLAQFCGQWLGGSDARLTRAAAQALGILAEVEGASFGRRVPALLPQLADVLASRAEQDAAAAEAAAVADPSEAEDLLAAAPGWQEAYYSLLLLQRVLEATAAQLAWAAGPAAQRCWGGAQRLLLHRHQWVRKASGRLVGAGLAAPAVGPPMLEAGGTGAAGALALSFFRQLDSEAADDALSGQAVKCLVFLCTAMYDDDAAAGRLPPPLRLSGATAAAAAAAGGEENGEANGHAQADEEEEEEEGSEGEDEAAADEQQAGEEAAAGVGGSDSEGEEEGDAEEEAAEASAADEAAAGSLTLHGLVRRMVRLADDKTYARQLQRGIALRFIAAVASRLGVERVLPYLPLLMRPLYRITEPGAAGNPAEVTSLADEIVAHLRTLVGGDAMLAAYNQAREAVRRQRGERKRKAALQTLVDPEAAAKRKIRKQQRKAAGKRKQMEHVKRLRAAGVTVKNKKQRTDDERGGGRRGRY